MNALELRFGTKALDRKQRSKMKIRSDFVTNSSSSCFCVTLTLQFDNDKNKTIRLKMAQLMGENRDLPLKTLNNKVAELFGMGLGKYLKSIGIMK